MQIEPEEGDLTSKLGSTRRMNCSRGEYSGGQGMPEEARSCMAWAPVSPKYTTSPAHITAARVKKLQMSVVGCWHTTMAVAPLLHTPACQPGCKAHAVLHCHQRSLPEGCN